MPSISVIIVTHNSADVISGCLDSFREWIGKKDVIELILIDNASRDGTPNILKEKYPGLKLVENTVNRGFAAAVNQGIALAKFEYVMLLNPDTELQEGFLANLIAYLDRADHPAVIGCRLLDLQGTPQISCWKDPSLRTLVLEMFLPYHISLPLVTEQPLRTGEVSAVSGAAMVLPRALAGELSGFDEGFFMYLEDLDFCKRAKKAGYLTGFLEEARVKHIGGKSSSGNLNMFFVNYYSSKLRYFRKHFSAAVAGIASLLIHAGCALRIPIYALAGLVLLKKEFMALAKAHLFALPRISPDENRIVRN